MKYSTVLIIFSLLYITACNRKQAGATTSAENERMDSLPPCVEELIKPRNKQSLDKTPVKVDEYLYNNKKVYLLTAPCCDQYNLLYSDSCTYVCAPTGGFTGSGDGRCKDFSANAKFIKQVWKDSTRNNQ